MKHTITHNRPNVVGTKEDNETKKASEIPEGYLSKLVKKPT